VFVEWFNEVWKRPPNRIVAEPQLAAELGPRMRAWLDLFESLLDGRDFLFGEFGAADAIAFPFLKYAVLGLAANDTDPFHRVLVEQQPLGGDHPRLQAWVRRVDALPRA
jgi:glutathione S-transferase